MLNEEEIRSLIVRRILQAVNAGTYAVTCRLERQVMDLIMVLTGEKQDLGSHIPDHLGAVGIPYFMNENGSFSWHKEWLEDHGFVLDPENEDSINHPRFSCW
jgi:hypothetical protein